VSPLGIVFDEADPLQDPTCLVHSHGDLGLESDGVRAVHSDPVVVE
jgi:hypothetical protein